MELRGPTTSGRGGGYPQKGAQKGSPSAIPRHSPPWCCLSKEWVKSPDIDIVSYTGTHLGINSTITLVFNHRGWTSSHSPKPPQYPFRSPQQHFTTWLVCVANPPPTLSPTAPIDPGYTPCALYYCWVALSSNAPPL